MRNYSHGDLRCMSIAGQIGKKTRRYFTLQTGPLNFTLALERDLCTCLGEEILLESVRSGTAEALAVDRVFDCRTLACVLSPTMRYEVM